MIRSIIAALLAASVVQPTAHIRGFAAAQLAAERSYEAVINSSPNAAQAMRDELGMASYVHRMGQAGDKRSAMYFRDELAKAGWDARLVEYDVAIAYPTVETLTLTAPKLQNIDLYEPAVPGDPYSQNHAAIGKPYSAYTADGDVTGPIVYANYGLAADYKTLASMGVSVSGAIILARVGGGGSLTGKAYEAAKHGAKAVLLFSDPMRGGYWDGDSIRRARIVHLAAHCATRSRFSTIREIRRQSEFPFRAPNTNRFQRSRSRQFRKCR